MSATSRADGVSLMFASLQRGDTGPTSWYRVSRWMERDWSQDVAMGSKRKRRPKSRKVWMCARLHSSVY